MIARGLGGKIVNVSSGSYKVARVGASAYCSAKAGLVMFTACLAQELGPHKINVNSVAPGLIEVGDESTPEKLFYDKATIRASGAQPPACPRADGQALCRHRAACRGGHRQRDSNAMQPRSRVHHGDGPQRRRWTQCRQIRNPSKPIEQKKETYKVRNKRSLSLFYLDIYHS